MRLVGVAAQTAVAVGLVILVVALEPFDVAVALEGQHVGGDAVEEPAIMADDHRTAGEIDQRLFQRAQRVDVEVVGRLVEQQHVGAAFQHLGQVDAVALASRELTDLLLLVDALEVERTAIGAARHLAGAELDDVEPSRQFLPHRLVGIERLAALVDITQLHRRPDGERPRIGLVLADDHLEQGRLAGAVGTDHADDAAGRQVEGEVVDQEPIAEALGDLLRRDDVVAEPRAGGDDDLRLIECRLLLLGHHLLVGRDARLALGAPRMSALAHPFQFALQGAAARIRRFFLERQPLVLLLQPRGVVALPRDAGAAVELEDPAGHVVEEVAVVGDGHHGAGEFLEMALQPGHRFGVEMVGRFVEQQHVGLAQEQPAERHAAALAARQCLDLGLGRRAAQRVHGDLDRALEVPAVAGVDLLLQLGLLGDQLVHVGVGVGEGVRHLLEARQQTRHVAGAFHDVAQNVFLGVELGLLLQHADPGALGRPGLAGEIVVVAGHELEQGRFSGAVQAEHADFGARQEGQPDVLQDLLAAREGLVQALHDVDVLVRGHRWLRLGSGLDPGWIWVGALVAAPSNGFNDNGRNALRMLAEPAVLALSLAYVGLLFAVAYFGDRHARAWSASSVAPAVYGLSLAIYCTSWTFYGAVGRAATSGIDFILIYTGPALVVVAGYPMLRKMVRLAKQHNVTSIADFLASRYGKSRAVGVIATLFATVGVLPYIALQLQAVSSTFRTIAAPTPLPGSMTGVVQTDTSLIVAALMAVFTILFGVRHVQASEQHRGMMLAIAFESVVKLLALLTVGPFVLFVLFSGPADLLAQVESVAAVADRIGREGSPLTWVVTTLLSAMAFLCLPRQFHVAVVEHGHPASLRTARWLFPSYLVLINLFVVPIAAAGLLLLGSQVNPDLYVLQLPLANGESWLSAFVFIGGLSAATSMVIVACMALSGMIGNELVMPYLLRRQGRWGAGAARDMGPLVVFVRRAAVVLILMAGYAYERIISGYLPLASIGLISFCAVANFAPGLVLGLYWRRAHRLGVVAGLAGGFVVWLYALLLPTLQQSAAAPLQGLLPAFLPAPFAELDPVGQGFVVGI